MGFGNQQWTIVVSARAQLILELTLIPILGSRKNLTSMDTQDAARNTKL